MAVIGRLRESLLQQVAQCLMRQADAKDATEIVSALVALFAELPMTWHATDLFSSGQDRTRLASFRCPRGFPAFVENLGFDKRLDGVYQGTFAASTLLLVKVADPGTDRWLLSAIGLPKSSPLNDGPVAGCLGAVVRASLARITAFEAEARRALLLRRFSAQPDDVVAVFDRRGALVEQYPSHEDAQVQAVLQHAARDGTGRAMRLIRTADGRTFEVDAEWMTGKTPLRTRHCLVRARVRTATAGAPIAPSLGRYGLSKREIEVGELVFRGNTNQQVAAALFISPDTVKTHCRHIFEKMGVGRRTEFVAMIRDAECSAWGSSISTEKLTL
jgi:DNA-binding CsgD family transcriptional regulator